MSVPHDRPEFATSIRGYDRVQVDDYIERLSEIAEDAEERARVAEAELEFSLQAIVGPRVAQILELAAEEGRELRARMQAEADRMRYEARADEAALVEGARDVAEAERIRRAYAALARPS